MSLEIAAVTKAKSKKASKNISLDRKQIVGQSEISKLFKGFETNLDSNGWSLRLVKCIHCLHLQLHFAMIVELSVSTLKCTYLLLCCAVESHSVTHLLQ